MKFNATIIHTLLEHISNLFVTFVKVDNIQEMMRSLQKGICRL